MKARLLLAALLSPAATAHYIPSPDTPTTLDTTLVATWRSASLVGDYDFWQVPGTLMGGHAWPAKKGVEIDEMTLMLGHRLDENLFGVIKIGSHPGNDDHGGVELEHAYLGWTCCDAYGPWVAEVGRMSAAFSPGIMQHPSDRLASESPLALDVFFGRHFHDQGARIWWHETAGLSIGAEIWRGDAFPATASSGGGAWDVFARYAWAGNRFSLTTGGWFYYASAEARADHRYGGGHQHVPVAPPGESAALFPDIRYTGDTDIYGTHVAMAYQPGRKWRLGMEAEWIWARLDGVVHDGVGREAVLDGRQQGGWVQPHLQWRDHTLAVRAERLSTDNNLSGPAAPQLAEGSGLANPENHTPQRVTAIWRWQWRPALALRAEFVDDRSLPQASHRWTLGVIWTQNLWPGTRNAPAHHMHH